MFNKGGWPRLLECLVEGGAQLQGQLLGCEARVLSGCLSFCVCLFPGQFKFSLCCLLGVWPLANFLSFPGLSFCICKAGLLLLASSSQRCGGDEINPQST